jgi:hypothetical protein
MNHEQGQQRSYPPAAVGQSRWQWGTFLVFCVMLIFAGWVCGFLVPVWVAVIMGGMIGLVGGLCHWFD